MSQTSGTQTRPLARPWLEVASGSPFLLFIADNGDRYLAYPSHIHGHLEASKFTLTLHCDADTITILGPATGRLTSDLAAGIAQEIRSNGVDLFSVVFTLAVTP